MKKFDFTFRGDLKLSGAEEHLLDQMCDKLDSNTKDIVIKTHYEESYKNFTTELENGIELDCEISWDSFTKEWKATVWQMD